MDHLELIAAQTRWSGENIAYNLEFVPDEKLCWKPSPTANSALEIVNHTVGALKGMQEALGTGTWEPPRFTPATDRRTAQALIREASRDYAEALRGLAGTDFNRTVQLPWGAFPLRECIHFPVFDLFHHRGQICYLQTIWGDTQDHFDPNARP